MYIYENFFYSGPFYFVCTLILRGKNRCWLQFTCNGQSPRTCSLNSFGDFRRNCIWWIIEILQYSLNSMTVLQPLFSCGRSHSDYLYIYRTTSRSKLFLLIPASLCFKIYTLLAKYLLLTSVGASSYGFLQNGNSMESRQIRENLITYLLDYWHWIVQKLTRTIVYLDVTCTKEKSEVQWKITVPK